MRALSTAAGLLFAATLPAATVINFENLTAGTVLTNQYAAAVFSSTPGKVIHVWSDNDLNGTPPNFICPTSCTNELIVDFTGAVNGLNFQALGINDTAASVAQVDVWVAGALAGTVPIPGAGELFSPRLVDLSAFASVTRIRVHSITDTAGIGWDTFRFMETPEPGTWLSCAAALAVLVLAGQRRARCAATSARSPSQKPSAL